MITKSISSVIKFGRIPVKATPAPSIGYQGTERHMNLVKFRSIFDSVPIRIKPFVHFGQPGIKIG